MRVRIGIVGFGGFGQFLCRSWEGMDEVEVVAVADENPDVQVSGPARFTDWRALVRDPAVDLVAVATPPHTHADIACAAMDAGKHVLVEKPLATTRADANRVIDRAAQRSVVATIDYMLRFNPLVELLHDWSRNHAFGRLRRVLVENYAQDDGLPPGHWFWDTGVSGGILVEHAVHFIDMIHGCTPSAPAHVDGYAVPRQDGRIDRMGLTAVYSDGLVTTQYHAFSRPGFFESTSMRFVFDLAQVDVLGWIPLSGRMTALVSDATESELERLPRAVLSRRVRIDELPDDSRPRGWGDAPGARPSADTLRSGGLDYRVHHLLDLDFNLRAGKADVYAGCLQDLMRDLLRAIDDRGHRLRVTLEDGFSSLEVALRATEAGAARAARSTA